MQTIIFDFLIHIKKKENTIENTIYVFVTYIT